MEESAKYCEKICPMVALPITNPTCTRGQAFAARCQRWVCYPFHYPRSSGPKKLAMWFDKASIFAFISISDLTRTLACLLLKAHVTMSQCGAVLVQLQPGRIQMEMSTAGDGVVDAAAILVA